AEGYLGLNGANRAIADIRHGQGLLGLAPVIDGFDQGSADVRLDQIQRVGEVQMQMGVDKTGKHQPFADIQHGSFTESQLRPDLLDLAGRIDANVDRLGLMMQAGVADSGDRGHGPYPSRAWTGRNPDGAGDGEPIRALMEAVSKGAETRQRAVVFLIVFTALL